MHSLLLPLTMFCLSTWDRKELLDCAWFRVSCGFYTMTFLLLASFQRWQIWQGSYCTETNMCRFLWESINRLSVLFATETCYTIKENNNREKLFCRGKLPFLLVKIEKRLFCISTLFACAIFHFDDTTWETAILRRHFLGEGKILNWKSWQYFIIQRIFPKKILLSRLVLTRFQISWGV